ncbi:hypothetical protein ACROYT_G013839 [Oculina patagonica]
MARTVNGSQLSYWATTSYKMAIGTEKRVSGQTACSFKVKTTNNASLHNSLLYVPGPKVIYSTEGRRGPVGQLRPIQHTNFVGAKNELQQALSTLEHTKDIAISKTQLRLDRLQEICPRSKCHGWVLKASDP